MVTAMQLRELNKKIDGLKDKNSAAIAELKVLQGQFDAKAKALSEMLGLQVTADNVEALYMQAQQQLEEKAVKIDELLRDLEGGERPLRPLGTPTQNLGSAFGYTGQAQGATSMSGIASQMGIGAGGPIGFGVANSNTQPAGFPVPDSPLNLGTPATPVQAAEEQGVTPSFANFGTGTVFNI